MFNLTSESSAIRDIKDPFKKDCLQGVYLSCWKSGISNKTLFTGRIEFINGSTKGEHKIEATDFNSLVLKAKNIIDNL